MDRTITFAAVLAGSMLFGAAIGNLFSAPILGCIVGGIVGWLFIYKDED